MGKSLYPLTNDILNKHEIYGFDVETEHVNKDDYIEQKFILGAIYGKNLSRIFLNKNEMCDFILSRKFHKAKIFASNLDFDLRILLEDDKRLKDFFMIEKNGLIYAKFKNIRFYDTWNYTGRMTVQKMGEFLNIPKMEKPEFLGKKPKNYSEWNYLKEYCLRDAEITQKFAVFMQNFCNKIKCKHKITLASIGLDFWRRNFQQFPLYQDKKYKIQMIYKAFHGGRVEMLKRGLFNEKTYIYDYNSHYPACCFNGIDKKGNYPNPNTSHYLKKGNIKYLENEGVCFAKIKMPYSYISPVGIISDDNKYIFPYGKLQGYFTHVELRNIMRHGGEIEEIGEMVYYSDLFIPFRECIKFLYTQRIFYKEKNNMLMSQMLKTLMNSGIFGKFAQKIETQDKIIHEENIKIDENGNLFYLENGNLVKIDKFIQRGKIFYLKEKNDKIPNFIHPILSVYTTALARIKLFNEAIKHENDILYMDTDSIISLKRHWENNNELGELKLEKECEELLLILPKLYYYQTNGEWILKSKGLPKNIKTKTDFLSHFNDGSVLIEKWVRYRESHVRKIPFASIIKQHKKIGFKDTKRHWEREFKINEVQDSKPLYINTQK